MNNVYVTLLDVLLDPADDGYDLVDFEVEVESSGLHGCRIYWRDTLNIFILVKVPMQVHYGKYCMSITGAFISLLHCDFCLCMHCYVANPAVLHIIEC